MKCLNCGAEVGDSVKFCCSCGNKIELPNKKLCRKCGAEFIEGAKFCSICGAKAESDYVQATEDTQNLDQIVSLADNESTKTEIDASFVKNSAMPQEIKRRAKTTGEKSKKNSKKILIIGVVLLGIILIISLISSISSLENGKGSKIEVVDVTGMAYADAVKTLNDIGFTNIVAETESESDETQWFVTEQSVDAGKTIHADDIIKLTCGIKCQLYLDITSESNLLFSTYDISITLDGKEIGSVGNGEEFTYLTDVITGEHELGFCKSGNTSPNGKKEIKVSGDMTYKCELSHDKSSIGVNDESTENAIVGASLEVVDVTGMILSEAEETLNNIGFSNLKEVANRAIIDEDNWIVTKQGLPAGTVADKAELIQLDCISFDDYLTENYTGKNINEVEKLAEKNGFTIRFEDTSGKDMDSEVSAMDANTKKYWVVSDARQYGAAEKTAVIKIKSTKVEHKKNTTPIPNSSDSTNQSKKYSDNEVKKSIEAVLGTIFSSGDYNVWVQGNLVNVQFIPEGITALAYQASERKDADAIEAWNSLVTTAKQWSKDLKNHVNTEMNRPDLNVSLYYCHDIGSGNVLLVVMDGTVFYDFVNNIDLVS